MPDTKTARKPKPDCCDYCGEAWDEENDPSGYVKAYGAWVHESCYIDHHGEDY